MTTVKENRQIVAGLLATCGILVALLIGSFCVQASRASANSTGDEHKWSIAEKCDYPMLLNRVTGETWVRACPGGPASTCKWVHMPREFPVP